MIEIEGQETEVVRYLSQTRKALTMKWGVSGREGGREGRTGLGNADRAEREKVMGLRKRKTLQLSRPLYN